MNQPPPTPVRRQFNPADIIATAIELIRRDYWNLFLGCLLASAIMSIAFPLLFLLFGPLTIGIHRMLVRIDRDQNADAGEIFKPFDNYRQNVIPGAFMIVGTLIFASVCIVLVGTLTIFSGVVTASYTQLVPMLFSDSLMRITGLVVGLSLGFFCSFFQFAFPLQAEFGLNGTDAIMLSFKGAKLNIWRLAGLNILLWIGIMAGSMVCGIGQVFVIPLVYASHFIAYRRIFPVESEFDF